MTSLQPPASEDRTLVVNPVRSAWPARIAAVMLAAFGFLPIVNWIAGGRSAPWYDDVVGGFVSGTAIALGGGLVLAIVSRRVKILWPPRWSARAAPSVAPKRAWLLLLAGCAGFILYASIARAVFDARPLLVDEIVQVFQARVFTEGRLWLPQPSHPEFTSVMHVVSANGRVYGQFPPGGPALQAIGELLHVGWLVGPFLGALSVVLFGLLIRELEPSAATRRGAVALLLVTPFVAFMSGTYMNHVGTLTCLLLATIGLVRGLARPRPSILWGLLAGLGFGLAATIRPLDALAFALPAAVWYVGRALRDHSRIADLLAAGLGVAIPLAALFWINQHTTGDPLLFGYQVLWGKDVGLGFHASPWGESHTPARGLELVSLYFLRLQTYLYEAPIPALLPVLGALALTPRLTAGDRYLVSASGLLVLLYFGYWHDGFYLGPRFLFCLAPVLVLWTARLPGLVRDRWGDGIGLRTVVYAGLISMSIAATVLLPIRVTQYRNGMLAVRQNADSTAIAAGAQGGLVIVRESWGAQLLARLWASGISRPEAERLYRSVDGCVLENAITAADALGSGDGRNAATSWLQARLNTATKDSARLVALMPPPDTTLRYLPGSAYGARCVNQLRTMRGGFTTLLPLIIGSTNSYVRSLGDRDTLLLAMYPGKSVFIMTRGLEDTARLTVKPASMDSILRAGRHEPAR